MFAFKSDSAILSIAFLTLAKNHPKIHHSQSHIIMVMGTRFSPSFVQVRLDNTGSIAFAAPAQNRAKMHHPQPHMQYIKISHQALVLVVWERVLLRS